MRRPCADCGALSAVGKARCTTCEALRQFARNRKRTHYSGDYRRRAALVRANATLCWLCGEGWRSGDPWQADHVVPGDPMSELRAAHRSCNARRGNGSRASGKAA